MGKLTYLEVGVSKGLIGKRLKLYVAYMHARWSKEESLQCSTGYADEWANRFLCGDEYCCSDLFGQEILDRLYKNKEV
jgi:hypothetical protein